VLGRAQQMVMTFAYTSLTIPFPLRLNNADGKLLFKLECATTSVGLQSLWETEQSRAELTPRETLPDAEGWLPSVWLRRPTRLLRVGQRPNGGSVRGAARFAQGVRAQMGSERDGDRRCRSETVDDMERHRRGDE
jgi:hypothetical protein